MKLMNVIRKFYTPTVVRVLSVATVLHLFAIRAVHAGIIPTAPTFNSPEFTTIQTETADVVLVLGWGVTAVIAVTAVVILFRLGKKVVRKLSV